ncbi:hypothetical protein OH809_44985 (plasmid) [Streptomyces sp. NBC_00873]|uniref:hypothetical protein n=1 Tax=Streptomyces sp. NBC_00873 TaxID=2975852 RepID=UPI0037DD803D|nr:hypothetical protein OH809_44985 [Streptomyces sp. NBC_00873]
MPAPDDEFDRIIKEFHVNPSENIDQNPYGAPAQPSKAGLTKRGKAALGIGAAVIAGGGLIGYQVHSANVAESEAKAQEIALKSQALELEKLRETNRANEADRKARASQEKARQASVDTCVKDSAHLVGKGYGSPSHRDIVSDCQTQYTGPNGGDDMKAAASATDTGNGSGGGVNQGLLVGGGVLVVFLVAAAKKGTRTNPA